MTLPAGSIWPTAQQEALLRLVLGPDDEVAARWADVQPLDLNELDQGTFCLLPLTHTRLAAAAVDDALAERIAGTYRSIWYRNQIALRRLAAVVAALAERDVAPAVFGGASVAQRFYPQLGHRPLPQVDLIVPADVLATARAVVESQGAWEKRLSRPAFERFEDAERFVVVLHAGGPADLGGPARENVRDGARELELDGATVRVLAAADELAIACGLGARVTVPRTIQWLVDAAFVATSDELDADRAVASAHAFGLAAPVRDAIAYLARVAPGRAFGELAAVLERRAPTRRDELAYRLGTRGDRVSQRLSGLLRR